MTIAATPPFDFHKRFRAAAYLLVVLAVAGFSFAEGNPSALILILAAAAISWVIVEGPRGRALPRAMVNVGVLATASVLFYELVFEGGPRQPGPDLLLALGHFMTGILVCKLFERKTSRDYAQILTLTLLVMVAAAIFSASLVFAFILVVYLSLAFYALMLLHLRAETEGAVAERLLAADHPSIVDVLLRRDIRRVASWSMVVLAATAVGVFLFIPRSRGQGLLSAWSADATFQTGFSDRIRFHDYGQLQLNDAVVMEVKLEQNGANIGSDYYQPYFRGTTLDTYDIVRREWVRSEHADSVDHQLAPGADMTELIGKDLYNSNGLITQQYSLRATGANMLFTLSPPVLAGADSPLAVSYSDGDYTLTVRGQPPRNLRYTIVSALMVRDDSREPAIIAPGYLGSVGSLRWGFGEISEVPVRVRQFARDIIKDILPQGEQLTPERIRPVAERIEEYLRDNYPYSLNLEAKDPTLDPTEDFLFNRRKTGGNCEYFASAMVMLCRSVGINARIVTGYRGGDFNSISGCYVVREKYAHAWVEVYMPGRGWVRFDPTPAAVAVADPSALTWFRDMAEIVQKDWLSSIIGFDNSSRSYIFDSIRGFLEYIPTFLHSEAGDVSLSFEELLFSRNSPWSDRFIGGSSTLVIVGMTFWLTYRWNRHRTSPIGPILRKADRRIQRQLSQELFFFDELLRVLARTRWRKRAEQTPREYVEMLAPVLRGAASDARWLVAIFYDVRFGATRTSAVLRSQIATALSNVRRELHGK